MGNEYDDIVMECNKCKLQFYISQLNLDPKTDTMICKNCLNSKGSKVTVIKDRPPKKEEANTSRRFWF